MACNAEKDDGAIASAMRGRRLGSDVHQLLHAWARDEQEQVEKICPLVVYARFLDV